MRDEGRTGAPAEGGSLDPAGPLICDFPPCPLSQLSRVLSEAGMELRWNPPTVLQRPWQVSGSGAVRMGRGKQGREQHGSCLLDTRPGSLAF